ncbi:hypothetical protein GF337_05785 [candidate division KSB1 bacterium]|nr:hypothetical protein [candidate division KSB1 bacterium]
MKFIFNIILLLVFLNCNSDVDLIASKDSSISIPDDSTIAFIITNKEYLFHVATYYTSEDKLFHLSKGIFDTDVCWSKEKKYLYYTKYNKDENKYQIWKMRFDGSEKRAITPFSISCTSPQISPNGQKLSFCAEIENYNQIIITDTAGGNWYQLTSSEIIPNANKALFNLPSWVSDGQHILTTYHHYIEEHYSHPKLAKINIYNKNITFFNKIDSLYPHHAKWSPIYEEILFVGKALPGDQIYRINSDQTNLIKLTDSFIAGSPD